MARYLQINTRKKTKFDKFWDIAKVVIEELAVINDRRHVHCSTSSGENVVNMVVAISARDLYQKCKIYLSKELPESEIPSFSWFKFQFWPKDLTTHSALNYTGRFPVKYMLQQRMVRKSHDDDHYMNAPFNYAQEYAINIRDICCFICTDDKHKIDIGKPNFPLAAVPRGEQMPVARNEALQAKKLHPPFSFCTRMVDLNTT